MAKEEIKTQPKLEPKTRRVKAITRYLRIAPRKMRLVIDTIRREHALEAVGILSLLNKKGAKMAIKTLKSAIANAKNLGLDEKLLYVSDARADGGPVLKRFLTRSMGRADKILKRTTHLTVEVREGTKIWGGKSSTDAKVKNKKKAAAGA
ncbi:MAG TPA: 50S ribosomal protein L22 [Candidatus Omnitrophota bacterium]|nr:50S ribosomal protein L22 [Candidatus Omnitrophota bacterium]